MMHVPSLIERKRDGGKLSGDEMAALIDGYTLGEVPDYQMAAWAMARFFLRMDETETTAPTCGCESFGPVFAKPAGTPPKVDKHSTGGVGDQVLFVTRTAADLRGRVAADDCGAQSWLHGRHARQARECSRFPHRLGVARVSIPMQCSIR
jgi:thymidine phosphorylase